MCPGTLDFSKIRKAFIPCATVLRLVFDKIVNQLINLQKNDLYDDLKQ